MMLWLAGLAVFSGLLAAAYLLIGRQRSRLTPHG